MMFIVRRKHVYLTPSAASVCRTCDCVYGEPLVRCELIISYYYLFIALMNDNAS